MRLFSTLTGFALLHPSTPGAIALTDPLRPAYHVTNPTGNLGKLAGVVSIEQIDTPFPELQFHAFFQVDGQPSWSHMTSTDLISWALVKDAAPPAGAAGGSVFAINQAESPGISGPTLAVALSSASSSNPTITAASASNVTLTSFKPFTDPTTCAGKGVICLAELPTSKTLGDASGFQVPERNQSVVTVVVTDSSNIEFFESPDLVHWTAAGAALTQAAGSATVSSPELFSVRDDTGNAVLMYSSGTSGSTVWSTGAWDPINLKYTPTTNGIGDSGSFSNGKTTLDNAGERVQFGAIDISFSATSSGALSLPRQLHFVENANALRFRPHPAVWQVSWSISSACLCCCCATFPWQGVGVRIWVVLFLS